MKEFGWKNAVFIFRNDAFGRSFAYDLERRIVSYNSNNDAVNGTLMVSGFAFEPEDHDSMHGISTIFMSFLNPRTLIFYQQMKALVFLLLFPSILVA